MKSFEAIKDQVSVMEKALNVFEMEVGDVYAHDAINKEFDFRLRTREAQLDGKKKGLDEMEKHQDEEREYIKNKIAELDKKETFISNELKRMEEKTTELDNKIVELKKQEMKMGDLIKQLHGLQEKEDSLKELEIMLEKEKVFDKERKQMLDISQRKNEAEKARLQRISDSLS